MTVLWFIAMKELRDALRNRWLLAISVLFAVLAVGIAWFGAAASGVVGFTNVPATMASLSTLATLLIPLIALMLAYDAIVGEDEAGTLLLLLSYPLRREQLLLGKFVGHGLILALATVAGFGAALVAILIGVDGVPTAALAGAFARFAVSSMMLGWVFLAMAYVLSCRVREKSTAAGLALAVWFFFVLVFDWLLLALLVLSEGRFSPESLPWVLLCSPTDLYRLINLSGFDAGAEVTGVLALGRELPVPVWGLWGALGLWMLMPLMLALVLFRRRV
ncbi:ABC-type transport system involved in multi-copper enzyme maturation, permease component [Alloalcanivorax dieselolei B5]|uniref:ABC-type transport system involved in multi-copper enzyme maturation, permease component n=1 Tax=Alcanivorax dieselolei (strain DSM 16502 / CGMCC 1.3690 / MCCC 1A00001 / B-5) TaxID=930169 RepID=K0CJE2_ALCDB|nr:ABC transporter permease subunit [Alloalcanivorax dieselolei]AFT72540.1 ABC-type transport system involved in multi-copper enzyme maturation, permease component [Alloalcanivorax dieselolei B5]GGJ78598.1 membrane protein NosY [Alloalcanivorax dieselolei]